MAAIEENLVPESRVKEMQYGMFRTADVEFGGDRSFAPRRLALRIELVQNRERLTPIALPAEEPIAQLVVDLPLPLVLRFEPIGDLCLKRGRRRPVECAGVDGDALVREALE